MVKIEFDRYTNIATNQYFAAVKRLMREMNIPLELRHITVSLILTDEIMVELNTNDHLWCSALLFKTEEARVKYILQYC